MDKNGWDKEAISAIAHELKDQPGALLPILRRIQDELGWIPEQSVPIIADALNLSRAEVHGVISFYHDFRHHPPGRHVLRLCRAESCQAMGAVYCLGNCACSPALTIDGDLYGRVGAATLDRLLATLEEPRQ